MGRQLDLFHTEKELEQMKYLAHHAIPANKRIDLRSGEILQSRLKKELQKLRNKIK